MKLNISALEDIRYRRGLNQTEMADLLGISKPYYSLLISGKRKLTINLTEKLYFKLGMSLKDIFDLRELNG